MKFAKNVALLSSVVLVATAAFHTTGYSGVARAAADPQVPGFLAAVSKGLWLFASYHWLFVATVATVASRYQSVLSRVILLLSAAVISVDAILLLVHVGPFIGEALLAIVAVGYAAGAALQKRSL